MIKGALFDIDDTLYSHTLNRVPGATLKALDKLKEKGIKIGICTSRVNAEMGSFPEELWNRIDCKILGTGAITMIEDRYYKAYTIDRELVKKYTDYFNERHINYDYTDINGDLYYWGNPDYVNKGRYLKMAGGKVMFKEYEDEDITNLFFFEATDEEYEHIQTIDPDIQISRWGNSGNICAKLVDKSFGLLKFCQMYSLTTDEVVAAGDGGNDDVMLEMAGIGIATDDAKDNTKKAADYICDKSIEDGGLYDALVDLKIIDEDRYEPKMFVFDYDSTLYDHKEGKIQENTLKALKELKENGKILCLNTSRSLAECINIPEEIKQMMNTIILSNGAMIITGNESKTTYINDEEVKKIIDYCDRNRLTYRYVLGNGTGYLNKHDEDKENPFY
ncbi:MAG: HAD-IIB family hydrolase, partial [Erysipelotrichaceae bacterium]|nr:HAD-IIB family hydrolase [Erysipelotrichaceae bacterium]